MEAIRGSSGALEPAGAGVTEPAAGLLWAPSWSWPRVATSARQALAASAATSTLIQRSRATTVPLELVISGQPPCRRGHLPAFGLGLAAGPSHRMGETPGFASPPRDGFALSRCGVH